MRFPRPAIATLGHINVIAGQGVAAGFDMLNDACPRSERASPRYSAA